MLDKFITTRIHFLYLLILTSFISIAFLIIERQVRINYPGSFKMYRGITYSNVDNEYYLDPVENYLSGKGWRRNPPVGDGSYYRRTPGYSLLYLFTRVVTPTLDAALILLVVIQFILYLVFFYSLSKTLILLDISPFIYNVTMLFLAVIPYFYHIILGTNTESISVFLIGYFVYCLIAGYKTKNPKQKILFYVFASFFIGYDTLTRPYLGILLLLLPIIVYKEYFKLGFKKYILYNISIGIIPILMIATWALRNYSIGKEIVFLEKAYHPESLDRMKPEFRGLIRLSISCCGIDGSDFNLYQIPLYFGALQGDTSFIYVENTINKIPKEDVAFFGKEKLTSLVRRYQLVVFSQKKYYDNKIAMPKEYSAEQISIEKGFDSLITNYKKNHLLKYYFIIPLKYIKQIIFHSNTVGIYFMQPEFRSHTFLNILRYISLLIHVSLFFFIFVNLFTTKNNWLYFTLFFIVPVVYLLFFSYFVQTIEQRYFSPILPILIIGATYSINKIYLKLYANRMKIKD